MNLPTVCSPVPNKLSDLDPITMNLNEGHHMEGAGHGLIKLFYRAIINQIGSVAFIKNILISRIYLLDQDCC